LRGRGREVGSVLVLATLGCVASLGLGFLEGWLEKEKENDGAGRGEGESAGAGYFKKRIERGYRQRMPSLALIAARMVQTRAKMPMATMRGAPIRTNMRRKATMK